MARDILHGGRSISCLTIPSAGWLALRMCSCISSSPLRENVPEPNHNLKDCMIILNEWQKFSGG